jgi:hypothetical protein
MMSLSLCLMIGTLPGVEVLNRNTEQGCAAHHPVEEAAIRVS